MKEARLIINPQGTEKVIRPPYASVVDNVLAIGDKKEMDISWRNIFGEMKQTADTWKEIYPYQDETHVNLDAIAEYPDKPFLIWWASDMHIGNVDTEYEILQRHIELIENTPNCGLVTVGDDIDFGILPRFEVRFMQTATPMVQAWTAKDLMAEFNGRNPRGKQLVLAHVIGNHTHSMMQTTGVLYEEFYRQSKAAILPGLGQMFLNYGEENYEVGLAHKYFGRSRLNVTLEGKRLMEYHYPNADVAVVGDFHKSAFEKFNKGGKTRLVVRPGTYRVGTGLFENNRGWGKGDLGGSCTVFYPDKHDFQAFNTLEEGINFVK